MGSLYERPYLAKLWGYKAHQAISKGVITPKGKNLIILFVTRLKQSMLTQYEDYIDGNRLFWEGEKAHVNDQRIVNSKKNQDTIHLFYRPIHHTPFTYYGKISLEYYLIRTDKPSEFTFIIKSEPLTDAFEEIEQHEDEFVKETERLSIQKSRIGQGHYRDGLVKLWKGCSVTGVTNLALVRASHAKPWRDCNNTERLDPYNGFLLIPNLDVSFDAGLISFKDEGGIILSAKLPKEERHKLGLSADLSLRTVHEKNKAYLSYHREHVLRQ